MWKYNTNIAILKKKIVIIIVLNKIYNYKLFIYWMVYKIFHILYAQHSYYVIFYSPMSYWKY